MTYFEFDIEPKDVAGASAVDCVNKALLAAVDKRLESHRVTKTEIAERLGVDKSVVSRWLRGNQNITPRKFGELLWALDFDFRITLEDLLDAGDNTASVHSKYLNPLSSTHSNSYKEVTTSTSSGSRQSQARFVPSNAQNIPAISDIADYDLAEG